MKKRSGGYARVWATWRSLPVMLGLAVALGGCSLGRTGPPAQLFDLGPGPGAGSAPSPGSAALPSPGAPGASGSPGASVASRAWDSAGASGSPAGAPVPAGGLAGREPVAISFTAAQMLTDTGVIWRVGDSASPHSYATYRWAAPPSQLVQQRVIDRLSAARPVVQDGVDPRAPVLQVTLTRFEQVYAPDGKSSSGQIALQAVLVRDRRVVDSLRVARGAPAPSQDAQGGVLALRAATDMAAGDLSTWLERSLAASAATPESATVSSPVPRMADSRTGRAAVPTRPPAQPPARTATPRQ